MESSPLSNITERYWTFNDVRTQKKSGYIKPQGCLSLGIQSFKISCESLCKRHRSDSPLVIRWLIRTVVANMNHRRRIILDDIRVLITCLGWPTMTYISFINCSRLSCKLVRRGCKSYRTRHYHSDLGRWYTANNTLYHLLSCYLTIIVLRTYSGLVLMPCVDWHYSRVMQAP